jgi:tripartite-type tricarboxylate transporter receptor subunit TctC
MHINVPINLIGPVKSGRLKAMAITGESRLAALPQLPTFAEAGVPNFDVSYWQGVVAPAGTSPLIVDKMSTELAKILSMSDVKERLNSQGADPFISNPQQFAAMIKAELMKYGKVIKAANIKLD